MRLTAELNIPRRYSHEGLRVYLAAWRTELEVSIGRRAAPTWSVKREVDRWEATIRAELGRVFVGLRRTRR